MKRTIRSMCCWWLIARRGRRLSPQAREVALLDAQRAAVAEQVAAVVRDIADQTRAQGRAS